MTALDALRALVEAAQYQRRHPESFFAQEDLNSAAYALLDADPDGTLLDKLAADARDGEALRLLREALPDEPAYPDNLADVSSPLIATNDSDLDDALLDVVMELGRARAKFGPMVSEREGMDVVSEEHHEMQLAMWYGVDARGRPSDPHDEAIQLAAMAVRFLLDVPRRKRHVIRLIAGGAGHDPEPVCDGCGKPWPCEEGRT